MRRMDTFSKPSLTKSSLAASRISWRRNFFWRSLRSLTPMSIYLYINLTPLSSRVKPVFAPFALAPDRDGLHFKMPTDQERTRTNESASRKVLRKLLAIGVVEFGVQRKIRAIDLHIDKVVHRHAGLVQNGLVAIQEVLDLVLDLVRNLVRLRIDADIASQIEGVPGENGVAERCLNGFVGEINRAALGLHIALRKGAAHGEYSREAQNGEQNPHTMIHDELLKQD